ncbi:TRAP transporter substrate-binding protein [Hominifimenecus sp. rT4P-3]|uniref:TRAP transporter substrate-binding protein n=1 Tax=Hominifimenecus sp. rT4P-3 TaxID=3242979 RepID=UPI003DA6842C
MKKLMVWLLSALLLASVTACGSGKDTTTAPAQSGTQTAGAETKAPEETNAPTASGESKKLLYVHGASDTSILQETAVHFKELLEEKSGGRYTVEIHPNFELGSLTESVEMIKAGEVQLSGVCLGSYYSPKLAFIDLPNAVPSIEAAYKLYTETEFRPQINEIMREQGIELLSFGAVYFREMSSNVPVHSAEDIAGINIRTLENSLHTAYWSALGANPSPLPWSETYIALQQGLVDAEENPLDSIVGSKLYEVQKYIVNTNHIVYTAPVMVNGAFFDSLSEEDQAIFRECGELTEKYAYEYARDYESTLKTQLEEKGMEFIDLSDEVLAQLKEKASSVYDTVREQIGDETMDAFLAAIDAVTK